MGNLNTLRLHQPAGGAADPVTVRDLLALQDNVRAVVDPLVKVLQAAGGVYLPLAGGTMAGAIAMGANKITGLAAASANGDALRYEQLLGVVTAAELGYLAGVTSGIQAQINALSAGEGAKGWINFNGTGTIAINDSFNVTSITDNGVGKYTITWATDFASAAYAVVATAQELNANAYSQIVISTNTQAAGSVAVALANVGRVAAVDTVYQDIANISAVAFGAQ